MIRVTLSSRDMARGREVGVERARTVRFVDPRFPFEGRNSEETHTLGAQGELAFCVATGLPWPATVNGFRKIPDVEPNWEVRFTPGRPKVIPVGPHGDPPERLVAHVTGRPPSFEVVGYIIAGWVQSNVPLSDPGGRGAPAHFFSPSILVPIDPGFHEVCGWERVGGKWRCAFCGLTLEELSRQV